MIGLVGLGTGTTDVATGEGVGVCTNAGVDVGTGAGVGLGIGMGVGLGTGAGVGVGTGTGVGLGTGADVGLCTGEGLGLYVVAGVGVGSGSGEGPGDGLGLGDGSDNRIPHGSEAQLASPDVRFNCSHWQGVTSTQPLTVQHAAVGLSGQVTIGIVSVTQAGPWGEPPAKTQSSQFAETQESMKSQRTFAVDSSHITDLA
jgi:hypothetical protein